MIDLKFSKVTIHLKFCKVAPFRVPGGSRWVVNALALWNTAETRKRFILRFWNSSVASPKIWGWGKNLEGAKMFDFRRITLSSLDTTSQSTKWLHVPKMLVLYGAPSPPGYAYDLEKGTAESRKLFILRIRKGVLHIWNVILLDQVKELDVLRSCSFPLSRRRSSFSFFSEKWKRREKNIFLRWSKQPQEKTSLTWIHESGLKWTHLNSTSLKWMPGATSSSFREGQFSRSFIRWRHRAYSTVVQLCRKRLQIVIFATFPKTRIFQFDQDADRTIRTE